MSEGEGVKKSGLNNALANPFRMNGRPADWAAQRAGVNSVAPNHLGRHMVIGAIGLLLSQANGFAKDFVPSARMDQLMSASLDPDRCPVGSAVFQAI